MTRARSIGAWCILTSLLLGLILSVLSAWGVARLFYKSQGYGEGVLFYQASWQVHDVPWIGTVPDLWLNLPRRTQSVSARRCTLSLGYLRQDMSVSCDRMVGISTVESFGFPLPCLSIEKFNEGAVGRDQRVSGWRGGWPITQPESANVDWYQRTALPLLPRVGSLIANMLFYALLCLFCWRTWTRAAWAKRRLRDRCGECGYPCPKAGACPECGANL